MCIGVCTHSFQCNFVSLALSFLVKVLSVCIDLCLVYFTTKRSEMPSHKAKTRELQTTDVHKGQNTPAVAVEALRYLAWVKALMQQYE